MLDVCNKMNIIFHISAIVMQGLIDRMFQCYDEKTIEDMTDEMEMMSNPNLVEKRKEMKEQKAGGPVCFHQHQI